MNAQHATHTPGPWSLKYEYKQPQSGSAFYIETDHQEGGTVMRGHALVRWSGNGAPDGSDGYWSEDIAQANARLIAAAPELLEALRRITAAIAPQSRCDANTLSGQLADVSAIARAALAKAGAL